MLLLLSQKAVMLTKNSEAKPPLRESIKQVTPSIWTIGSSTLCYAFDRDQKDDYPTSFLASWTDGPQTFYLVDRDDKSPQVLADSDSNTGRIYEAGSSSGVWLIGNEAIIKVKSWHPDHPIQSEPDTIAFIRSHAPSIPIPEPIFFRIDKASNRSIFVMRRVKGQNLQEAWPGLNTQQRVDIVEEISEHIKTMAAITRFRYESVDGFGLLDSWHTKHVDKDIPTWQLIIRTLGPFTIPEFKEYTSSTTTEAPLPLIDDNEPFVLIHADLNAVNIMVPPKGKGITIIDWSEAVGFFPRYCVTATCTYYRLENVLKGEEMDYKNGLKAALGIRGFPDYEAEVKAWKAKRA